MNPKNKVEVLKNLTPEMLEVLRIQDERSKDAFNTVGVSLEDIRDNYTKEREYWNEGGPVMVKTTDVGVTVDSKNIPTRIHCPNNKPVNECIFYIHGGGMVVGNLDTHGRIMRLLASYSDSAVIGIDYSLSPEARHPQALLECVEVVRYYRAHAAEYGIDPGKIGFAGDSGGANMSFFTMLYLRDHEEDTSYIKALLLYYGSYGMKDGRSFRLYGGAWDGLTEEDLEYYFSMYVKSPEQSKDPYCNAYENDLTHRIPPCFILACEYDPLIDDSVALYTILRDKGLPAVYTEYKGTIHAFLHYSRVMEDADRALREGAEFFKEPKV